MTPTRCVAALPHGCAALAALLRYCPGSLFTAMSITLTAVQPLTTSLWASVNLRIYHVRHSLKSAVIMLARQL